MKIPEKLNKQEPSPLQKLKLQLFGWGVAKGKKMAGKELPEDVKASLQSATIYWAGFRLGLQIQEISGRTLKDLQTKKEIQLDQETDEWDVPENYETGFGAK